MYIPYSLKLYSFIIIGTTLATDNKEYKERIQKLVMTTEGKIRDEKLKYNINRKRSDKYDALSNLVIYHTWKNFKKSYKNNKFKISSSAWNEEFELFDGSYSISRIQDYFGHISKKTWRKYY